MAKEIIFFDIDGTLLNPITFEIDETTQPTLQKLKDMGYLLGIATGRAYNAVQDVGVFDLVEWDIIVVNNGQRVLNEKHEVIYEDFIAPDLVQEFITKAHERGIAVMGQGERWHFFSEANDYMREVHDEIGGFTEKEEFDPNIGLYTLMVYGYDYDFIDTIDGLRYVQVVGPYADVMLESIDKFVGISKALDYLGLKEYIGMGDSANDFEMAKHAKTFIATHHASEILIPYADYQVESEHEEIKKGFDWFLKK
jgi:HAD superfamily hydrolase (TIGR01484 family)